MFLESYLAPLFRELRTGGALKDFEDPTLELSLVPNTTLRKLKKDFLKKDVEIVDVLSFPAPRPEDFPNPAGGRYLGEVYINKDIAREDRDRAVFLLIHGILHLLGYRHEKKHDSIVMERLEQELLAALL